MYELSPETKQAISKTVGLPWDTLINMTVEEANEKLYREVERLMRENLDEEKTA